MKGLLNRLFAPRWSHHDPAVRREAIARLDGAFPQDREKLEKLALDPDATVRQDALAKLEDAERLLELMAHNESTELRNRLVTLLTGQPGAPPLASRLALTERIIDPPLLTELALHGDDQQLRLSALARLSDEEALITQACENSIAAVRRAAAERIVSEHGLVQLMRRAKRDRQIARLARERLNRLREDSAQAKALSAERERILRALEQHAEHTWEPLYAGRYRHLQREWERLNHIPSAQQEQRYHDASLGCRKVMSDHQARQGVTEAVDKRRDEVEETRQSLIAALEEALSGLRQSKQLTAQDIASLQAHRASAESRWQSLSNSHTPDAAISQRYHAATEECDRVAQLGRRFEQHEQALKAAFHQRDEAQLRQLLAAIDWPSDVPPPALLAQVGSRSTANQFNSGSQQEKRFEQDLAELEKLLERGLFKRSSRLHQQLRQRLDTLPQRQQQSHAPALKHLGAQIAELRDWRSFVASPKREQLCHTIVQLAEDALSSDSEIDRRHRQLIKEWKDLGDAAASRELSTQFRQASDRIHERLRPWYEARELERQHNLRARQALCEQLEALIAKPDPQADPDALRQIRDRAREQWQRFSPVPREHAASLGRRFGHIRQTLQALIDEQAQLIAVKKREMIEQARQLQNTSMSASQRAEQAKTLQQRWRALGRAPKGEEQQLWREFRHLCDTLFAARESERHGRAKRTQEHLDAMQALIERMDAWQPATSRDTQALNDAINEAERLEPLPSGRRSDGMRRRWSGIVRARHDRLVRLELNEHIHDWQALQPLLSAHLLADSKVLEGQPAEIVDAEPPLDDPAMQRAHEQRNLARQSPAEPHHIEEALSRLRVHMALLAGTKIGREDEPLRLAIHVERLNVRRGQEHSKVTELKEILQGILATGPVPPALWSREVGELDSLLAQLARLPPP